MTTGFPFLANYPLNNSLQRTDLFHHSLKAPSDNSDTKRGINLIVFSTSKPTGIGALSEEGSSFLLDGELSCLIQVSHNRLLKLLTNSL